MSSELNEETTKDLMIKLFPKPSNEQNIQRRVVSHPSHNQRIRHKAENISKDDLEVPIKRKSNKTLIAIVLAVISVFILSPYVLNKIDDIASQRGYSFFNSKGEPTLIFLGVLVVVIGVINRFVIGFV